MKILYAEDEPAMAEAVMEAFARAGYITDHVTNGQDAMEWALNGDYDLAVFDVMMPRLNGDEALKRIRQEGVKTPCLLLTARSGIDDRINGLDAGADDYLTKPFHIGELLARVRALLRRGSAVRPSTTPFGDAELDPTDNSIACKGQRASLGAMEYRIAEALFDAAGGYVSAEQILDRAGSMESEAGPDTVWVYISGLRKKLKEIGSLALIENKRGIGYRLTYKGEPDGTQA